MTRWLAILLLLVSLPASAAITYVDHVEETQTSAGANMTIDISTLTGCTDGDLMIAFDGKDDDPGPDTITAGTWVEIIDQANTLGSDGRITAWYHWVTSCAGEPTEYVFNGDSEERWGAIVLLSGVDTSTPVDVTGNCDATENSSGSAAVTEITTTTDNAWVFAFITITRAVTATEPAGLTDLVNIAGDGAGSASGTMGYLIKTPAGGTGTHTWTDLVSGQEAIACLIALRPAGAAPAGRTRRMF